MSCVIKIKDLDYAFRHVMLSSTEPGSPDQRSSGIPGIPIDFQAAPTIWHIEAACLDDKDVHATWPA